MQELLARIQDGAADLQGCELRQRFAVEGVGAPVSPRTAVDGGEQRLGIGCHEGDDRRNHGHPLARPPARRPTGRAPPPGPPPTEPAPMLVDGPTAATPPAIVTKVPALAACAPSGAT